MFHKLRTASLSLSSRAGDGARRKGSAVSASPSASKQQQHSPITAYPERSLLGLPPELRDQIYQYAASSTTLTLPPTNPRKRHNPVSLLLVCRQIWHEYRLLLLAFATVIIQVQGYDFANAIRVLRNLHESNAAPLSSNSRLWILLLMSHVPNRDQRQGLKAWCEYRQRTQSQNRITSREEGQAQEHRMLFHYDFKCLPGMRPPRPPIRYTNPFEMQLDLLRAHLRMIGDLRDTAEQQSQKSDEVRAMQVNLLRLARVLEGFAYTTH